jgi:hypothetical protein
VQFETITDHLAVCICISIALPIVRMRRGLWKMDSFVIIKNACTEKFRTLWGCLRQKIYFADNNLVGSLCKMKIGKYSNVNKPRAEGKTV